MNDSLEEKPKIIVICGPTGIGKTALSLHLTEIFSGGIVSADSMQIYRHMDIGTAKPTPEEQARAPHFMIDVADPDEPYDAARYAAEARDCIAALRQQGKLPIVAGGTGLYIKALIHGMFKDKPASPEIRQQLRDEAENLGSRHLHDRLARHDPRAARRIHPNDTYRIMRALEVQLITGRPMSECQQAHGFSDAHFDALKIGLHIERETLYQRINRRVEKMIAAGLLREVRELLEMGYQEDVKPMQAIGYRHMADYIRGRMSWADAVWQMKRDTRRYAKRQLIWFRKDPELTWMAPADFEGVCSRIQRFLAGSA